jgi:putative ABC transport system permease protein
MSFSLATLWHERGRFLPGILAVGFSALLIAVQCGLLLGLLSLTSIPVDHATAEVWAGHPAVLSVDLGRPIPEGWLARVAAEPEVEHSEVYMQALLMVDNVSGHSNVCTIIGTRVGDDTLGAVRELTTELRDRLSEPGAIVVDESDMGRMGFHAVGDVAEVFGRRVRVVGTVRGLKGLAAPYLFCSVETARTLMANYPPGQVTYVLARCRDAADAPGVAARLRARYPDMAAFCKKEFSDQTQWYWLTATKSGVAIAGGAVLSLLVGAVVTSQTLFSATAASLKEYATLRALGIPSWRIGATVLAQALWVGGSGLALALPAAYFVAGLVEALGVKPLLPGWLLAGDAALTMAMATASGLLALRSLRLTEPAQLLR